jgi:hypothetical protein
MTPDDLVFLVATCSQSVSCCKKYVPGPAIALQLRSGAISRRVGRFIVDAGCSEACSIHDDFVDFTVCSQSLVYSSPPDYKPRC